jgi:AAA+ superfamily predicted ATPase
MPNHDETVRALRDALAASPDNMVLRRHLAELLVSAGKLSEAVIEYRQALSLSPRDDSLRLPLATVYKDLGNDSAALVIVEEILKQRAPPPAAYYLYAQLLLHTNQPDRAAHAYRQAVTEDTSLADADLARRLGIHPKTGQSSASADFDDEDRRVRLPADDGDDADFGTELERPKITFADVGGMEALKEEIRLKILHPLANPDLYKMYGKTVGGGILMYGPPGCGKTYLARATAGEAKAGFIAVGIEDVLDMWMGNSERRMHQLFETARQNTPCMLFFDEVDALGAKRSDMRTSAARMLVNQFLSELDGVSRSNEGVLILAATNAPWHVDSAFRRPGRFDRVLFVPPPDAPARQDILRLHLEGKPLGEIDYRALAAKTDHFSGADLKAVVDLAIEAKLGEALKTGRPAPVLTRDLLAAVKRHRPTTKEWFSTARNYAVYSNQDGTYDDILQWLQLK